MAGIEIEQVADEQMARRMRDRLQVRDFAQGLVQLGASSLGISGHRRKKGVPRILSNGQENRDG